MSRASANRIPPAFSVKLSDGSGMIGVVTVKFFFPPSRHAIFVFRVIAKTSFARKAKGNGSLVQGGTSAAGAEAARVMRRAANAEAARNLFPDAVKETARMSALF